jgi:hypothetical protein
MFRSQLQSHRTRRSSRRLLVEYVAEPHQPFEHFVDEDASFISSGNIWISTSVSFECFRREAEVVNFML